MIRILKNKILSLGLVFFFSLILIGGCSRQSKHDVLSFFFTGVPSPEEGNKSGQLAEKKNKVVPKKNISKKIRKLRVSTVFVHGPRASGRCSLCHDTFSSAVFKGERNETRRGPSSFSGGIPGRLAMPLDQLCVSCHERKSLKETKDAGLYLHAPAASGECTLCHDPHQARERYMLNVKGRKLCFQCHEEENIRNVKAHVGRGECLSCHNAHVGKNRMMLTRDYEEIF